ncbi:carbon-nitrogen hydrolase family protein [Thalassorhabdomicrobium marinisediminis]|uniref:carbon-nitrogen hydrolase family protein n=1 Tax=Thalassorhabdomicrobium marinisediminis TaxID=2170577 RepID=UPI001F548420|nr:carbon-nitrogen hydrolase family protein [Thalassorhabdomicrobium marinisediminis]
MANRQEAELKIAVWQTEPVHDPREALQALDAAAARARTVGAEVLVTPEMFLGGYNIGPARCDALAGMSGELIDGLASIARAHGLALVAGLALPSEDRPWNGVVVLSAQGEELHRYHKTHLYGDVDQTQFCAGESLSGVFELNGWAVGVAICYDIEFPELARTLALRGADILLVPTANMKPFDSVATRLVPARAEENAIFVAYANYVGVEGAFHYGGLSCICAPDGSDLARASDAGPDLLVAEVRRDDLARSRTLQTHQNDRRTDLY